MIYLSGAPNSKLHSIAYAGFLFTPMMGNKTHLRHSLWGADTGCFAAPHRYSDEKYLAWLVSMSQHRFTCLFATVPDVVGDAVATLAVATPMLEPVRAVGYRPAFVAQDGSENTKLPWKLFDCLFVGGTTDWKMSERAAAVVAEAKAHGKWIHMGRVNSLKRLKYSSALGCDSADGTYLKYGPDKNLPKLIAWLDAVNTEERTRYGLERAA